MADTADTADTGGAQDRTDGALELVVPALALVVILCRQRQTAQRFAERHFAPDEIAPVEPESLAPAAFEAARLAITRRLSAGLLAVALIADESSELSAALSRLGRHHDVSPVVIALGRDVNLARFPISPRSYAAAWTLATRAEWEAARVVRQPLACDLRAERGPFDIVGDIH
ncbi:MAG TPA: hypothetical protein VJR48_12140, partial [Ktedonobacterales bacterium]|nr:hypothetical protein [Ktedonobacterales bacterium]